MKKHFLLFSLFIFAIAFSALAKKVEIKSAQLVAKNFYYERINQKNATPYQSVTITNQYTENSNNQPIYYILTMNDEGFVIVSADDAATPIIGYSFTGAFPVDNLPDNFKFWMDHYRDQINMIRENNFQPTNEITSSWNHLLTADANTLTIYRSTTDVAPLLVNITWDQIFPYNAMCPADAAGPDGHALTGCVATAMAQIMAYWRYPATGQGYHCIFPTPSYGSQCVDFSNSTYDWDGEVNKPDKECNTAAMICYDAAVAVDMDFGPAASGALMSKVAGAYRNYFKYASTTQLLDKYSDVTAWNNLLKADIDAGEPVQYAGSSTASGGHSWVCDGYQGTNFHMNWGWSGYANGYFTVNALNPAGEDFNSNQQACVHIQPDPAQYPAFCTGPHLVTTDDVGMIEDGSGPVANYQGGSNCSWLINIDDSVRTVTLSFDRFVLNASDFVKVYDGSDATAPLLGSFSGSALPATMSSTGSKMFITFTSATGSSANGFLASYTTALNSFCSNNNVLTAETGTIEDGSGRFQYRNGESCRWTIQPPNAATITLNFNSFDTEQDKDVMKVFDKANMTTPLAVISGTYSNPLPASITSPSGGMMIMFISNKAVRGNGWNVDYTMTVGTDESKAFENLAVYPNPTNGFLNIDFTMNETQKIKIDLVSIQGSVIYSENIDSFKGHFQKHIDLSSVAKGVYMLRMTSDQGITNKKIVLQ